MATLSACETNVGVETGGEGIFALQRAFQAAGAKSVLASLWKVDDRATSVLMAEFYRELWRGRKSNSDALRAAQLTMLNRYDPKTGRLRPESSANSQIRLAPAYWAAFALSGDWR